MSLGALFLLALALAMDATAVAAAQGATARRIGAREAAAVALLFGGLHVVMPLLGWLAGARAQAIAARWDHWIAFVLLGAIGAKMLWDARRSGLTNREPLGAMVLIATAFATSIDALAVGLTLPLLGVPLIGSVAMIGGVTAVASAGGLLAGHRFGGVVGKRFEVLGGVVLIAIGTRILVEHLAAGR